MPAPTFRRSPMELRQILRTHYAAMARFTALKTFPGTSGPERVHLIVFIDWNYRESVARDSRDVASEDRMGAWVIEMNQESPSTATGMMKIAGEWHLPTISAVMRWAGELDHGLRDTRRLSQSVIEAVGAPRWTRNARDERYAKLQVSRLGAGDEDYRPIADGLK